MDRPTPKHVLGALITVAALLVLALAGPVAAAPKVPHEGPNAIIPVPGPGTADACRATALPPSDDGSSTQIPMGFSINFFGQTVNSLYVNNNGNVTFDGPLSAYTPEGLAGTHRVIIAPFFADVDTRASGSGTVSYSPNGATYSGRPAFCADWIDVGYYSNHADKLNSFQLILVDRSDTGTGNFDLILNYDRVQWETGDASGGQGGLGGSSAVVGYSNAGTGAYQLPGSLAPGSFLDSNTSTGLIYNSRDSLQRGRYVFSVRGGLPPSGGSIAGTTYYDQADDAHRAPGASLVLLLASDLRVSKGVTASSDRGDFLFTGVADGDYVIYAMPPAGDTTHMTAWSPVLHVQGGNRVGTQIIFATPHPVPSDVTVGGVGTGAGGVPVLNWGANTVVTKNVPQGAPGTVGSWRVETPSGTLLASGSLTYANPPGLWTGTIPPLWPYHGNLHIVLTVRYPDGSEIDEDFDAYSDPSGYVRNTLGTPVPGAAVTLFRADSPNGPWVQVPNGSSIMSPSNRRNPDQTLTDGHFGWDVIAGYYKVRAEKGGCVAPVESSVMQIPPPVMDLDIRIDCGNGTGWRFSDVAPTDYFYVAVEYLASHNIISGYADGTFRPYANTTRGQLAKIIVTARGWTIDTSGGPHFTDVPTTNPFYTFIETAYNHGVISGYGDGTFRWGANATRGQISKIIYSTLALSAPNQPPVVAPTQPPVVAPTTAPSVPTKGVPATAPSVPTKGVPATPPPVPTKGVPQP